MKTIEQIEKIKFLSRYKYLEKEIDRKTRELERWKSQVTNITTSFSDMPKAGKTGSIIENGIVNIDEIETKIIRDFTELKKLKLRIEEEIERIEKDELKLLLKYRYFEGMRWEEICHIMNYGWTHTHRMHESALNDLKI